MTYAASVSSPTTTLRSRTSLVKPSLKEQALIDEAFKTSSSVQTFVQKVERLPFIRNAGITTQKPGPEDYDFDFSAVTFSGTYRYRLFIDDLNDKLDNIRVKQPLNSPSLPPAPDQTAPTVSKPATTQYIEVKTLFENILVMYAANCAYNPSIYYGETPVSQALGHYNLNTSHFFTITDKLGLTSPHVDYREEHVIPIIKAFLKQEHAKKTSPPARHSCAHEYQATRGYPSLTSWQHTSPLNYAY